MPIYFEANRVVIEIAEQLIKEYHADLLHCDVAFLMVDKAPEKNGKKRLGWAKKIPADMQTFAEYDFLIVLAQDMWDALTAAQQRALIDHELCHCSYDALEDKKKLRGHDFEEFYCIIERHGLWLPDAQRMATSMQPHLPLEPSEPRKNGRVMAAQLTPDLLAAADAELAERVP